MPRKIHIANELNNRSGPVCAWIFNGGQNFKKLDVKKQQKMKPNFDGCVKIQTNMAELNYFL